MQRLFRFGLVIAFLLSNSSIAFATPPQTKCWEGKSFLIAAKYRNSQGNWIIADQDWEDLTTAKKAVETEIGWIKGYPSDLVYNLKISSCRDTLSWQKWNKEENRWVETFYGVTSVK